MAPTGWAYVECTETGGGGQAAGPTGSVQFLTGTNATSGSAFFTYHTASHRGHDPNTLILSGNFVVTGTISASVFHYRDVTRIDATGSTFFGDSKDDTHERIGSLVVSGSTNGLPVPFFSASAYRQTVHVKGLNVLYEYVNSATYTASIPSYIIGVRHATAVQIQIPSASLYQSGAILLIKDEIGHINGTDIKLSASSGGRYTIDGSYSYILTGSNPAISLYSNGANWFVF